nr:MAG TPA: hypothetical protein [Caudoviricetes sp.]
MCLGTFSRLQQSLAVSYHDSGVKISDLIFMCISCYDYAYQLRCTKQVHIEVVKACFDT